MIPENARKHNMRASQRNRALDLFNPTYSSDEVRVAADCHSTRAAATRMRVCFDCFHIAQHLGSCAQRSHSHQVKTKCTT